MKKFNIKLTSSLVGLFVSLILIILANKVKVCFSFGLMLLGFSLSLFALYKTETFNETLKVVEEELNEEDDPTIQRDYLNFIKKRRREKRRVEFLFYLAATLLVVVGFAYLIK